MRVQQNKAGGICLWADFGLTRPRASEADPGSRVDL